jgi:hypothetical protein
MYVIHYKVLSNNSAITLKCSGIWTNRYFLWSSINNNALGWIDEYLQDIEVLKKLIDAQKLNQQSE